jgi:class 3 adenylate cyclase/tetratricopeptide (TPR) repeat protein
VALCVSCGVDNPDRAKFCLECGAALPASVDAPRGSRKLVTVLFADVVGSTALGELLDPETMRAALARYFTAARTVLERHGGTVEKFIGDAVMAVFGIPLLHEDDALRAVRAADELRREIARLNEQLAAERRLRVEFRIGVNSGMVVAGGDGSGSFATGDPVNVAARLEQAAAPGEVLLGEATYRLVRDYVHVQPIPPIAAKGKSGELSAFRLVGMVGGAESAATSADRQRPFVGRRRELTRLAEAFDDAVDERRCFLFTLLGSAGVGKSRLVAEFLAQHAGRANVMRGRCLPYGDGITYWPIGEIVRTASGATEEDDPATIRSRIVEGLAGDANADRVADLLVSILGLSIANAPQEERFWAVRRFLEGQAREQPLICIVDDIHWAEQALLDLLENIADWSRDAPILLLCPARPELLEARPTWGGGKVNATTILLEPLNADATRELVAGLVGDAGLAPQVVERILATAEGNPLFAEEIVRMLTDEGSIGDESAQVQIPTSVQAVIAARLDRLPAHERVVAERAAVAGRVFERSAVLDLVREDERDRVPAALLALMRKELVQPSQADLSGDEAFRFRHMLIRDTAYEALPKQERTDLHERFAGWVERMAVDRLDEYAEIVGYHLELALRYRRELGMDDAHSAELASRAGDRFRRAGHRAYLRGEAEGSAKLLERAIALLPSGKARREALATLARAAGGADRWRTGLSAAQRLADEARAAGDEADGLRAWLLAINARALSDPGYTMSDDTDKVVATVAAFEKLGDVHGMAIGEDALSMIYVGLANWQLSRAAAERGLAHALAVGDIALADSMHFRILNAALWGPTPVPELLHVADDTIVRVASTSVRAGLISMRALAHAMAGDAQAAHTDSAEAMRIKRELGDPELAWLFASTAVETVLGDLDAAEAEVKWSIAVLDRLGETGQRSTMFGFRARNAFDQGRPDSEVVSHAEECRRLAAADDMVSQAQWRAALALVAARAGRIDEAKLLVDEAATLIAATDFLYEQGLTAQDRGYIHARAGEMDDARREYETALAYFEQKGDVMDARRVRERIAGL